MSLRPRPTERLSSERILTDAKTIKSSEISITPGGGEVIEYTSSTNTYQNDTQLVASIPNGLGLTWVNSTTIQVSPGFTVVNIGNRDIGSLHNSITKRINQSWVVGSGNGGRLINFAPTPIQTYHVFLLYNPLTNTTDVGFDRSLVAVNRPTGWLARRIGSILVDSGLIIKFTQIGNYFELDTPVIDLNSVEIAYTPNAALYKLTVPTGLEVSAKIIVSSGLPAIGYSEQPITLSIQPTSDNPLIPDSSSATSSTFRGTIGSYSQLYTRSNTMSEMNIPTNVDGEIQAQRYGVYLSTDYQTSIQTLGWTDFHLYRGR